MPIKFKLNCLTLLIFSTTAMGAANYVANTPDGMMQLTPGETENYNNLFVTNNTGDASLTINGEGLPGELDRGTVVFDGNIYVGTDTGSGSLRVDNGASVEAAGYLLVGTGSSSAGNDSTGTMTVDNGASVSANEIFVGNGDGDTGTGAMTVDNGASVSAAEDISVGYGNIYNGSGIGIGIGTMTVNNGASITAGNDLYVGHTYDGYGESYGTMTVSGASVSAGNDLYVGYSYIGYSHGTMNVDNGASVSVGGNIYVGYSHDPTGTGTGTGILSVDNDASVTASSISVGLGYGEGTGTPGTGTGTLTVDHGASVKAADSILIGINNGYGTVTVSNGASLSAGKSIRIHDGVLNIGAAAGDAPVAAGEVTAPGGVVLRTDAGWERAGVLNFNHTDTDYVFTPSVTGEGFLTVHNGTTTLAGMNTYAGNTIIQGGTLRAGGSGAFSGNSDFYMTQHGVLDLNGVSQSVGSLTSDGTVYFNQKGDSAGTTLTVNGDYHGSGGTLVFNTVLGGDDSATDFLHILGDADGGTNVKVNNLGGQGSQTVEGIKLITVDGNIADGTEFRQSGRIVAGAYDYRLVQGGNGGEHNSWYLTSGVQPPVVVPGPEPIDPTDPTLPEVPEPPVEPEIPDVSISRPEAGSYIANLAASEMFFTRMEDRGREHIYTDAITGEKKQTSMWLRSEGRHLDNNDSSGQLSTRENRYAIQMGGDMTDGTFTGADSWRLGLMAGYGNSHSNTRSDITGYQSKGDVDGYTMGLYGTWFENADRRSGVWVDTWLQYAWFSNSVQGEGLSEEKYDSDGLQASVETGYAFVLPGGKELDYIIEPQAQAIWNGVKAEEHRESNGTVVKSEGTNNVHTRLGVKGSLSMRSGGENGAEWKPYVAVNWHHNTKEYGVKMDDVTLSTSGARNTGELKVGVEGQLTKQLSVWGGASGQMGSDDYRDVGGFLGVRYGF